MKKVVLSYKPKSTDMTAINSAIAAQVERQQKPKIQFRYYANESLGEILVSNDVPPNLYAKGARLCITFQPGAVSKLSFDFCSNGGATLIEPLLGTVHRAVLEALCLKDAPTSAIELEDLTVMCVRTVVAFLAESETAAGQLLMGLAQHLKVAMDLTNPMPNKKWATPRKTPPAVLWSETNRRVLEAKLSFGSMEAYIAADGDHRATRFLDTDDEDLRAERLDRLKRLVCIEIEADISRVADPLDQSATLSSKLERWVPEAMGINPYGFVWTAFTWDTWLNLDLATDEAGVNVSNLTDGQQSVLQWYFDGKALKEHEDINRDHERFLNFRRALIVKAGIDLLNPWRYFRLNMAKALRATLTFDNRLKLDTSELAEATFTAAAALEAGRALDEDAASGSGTWL